MVGVLHVLHELVGRIVEPRAQCLARGWALPAKQEISNVKEAETALDSVHGCTEQVSFVLPWQVPGIKEAI